MNYWLVKSEPSAYSFDMLLKDKKTTWDGVRNYTARNHLKSMKKNDMVLFYHSNEGKEIVGIAKVVKEYYPDPTADDDTWVVVDLAPVKKLRKSINLETIKNHPILKSMLLVKIPRLSVMPVSVEEYETIIQLSEHSE
ncbi:MAG: EVE domain-containing protein [Cytophagaceae bacterium]|nr:EVE domain-containing protein [Cytophagaceae bacterium]MDW8456249.1 EVE domain-containing protein [Cytophagaceae bacterium]